MLLQNTINGLALGGVYALVALGYTLVYGVLQFINFAHSDIFMIGAFAGLFASTLLLKDTPLIVQFLGSLLSAGMVCVVVALLAERLAYRPLRKAPKLNVLITAIGVSLFLQNAGQVFFGSDPRVFPTLLPNVTMIESEWLVLSGLQVAVISISLLLMVFLHLVVHHTKMGIAMRAVSYDLNVANLMGIPSNFIIAFTFALGAALAGFASILYGMSYPKIEPLLGVTIGLKAFIAAVFGGIGNIFGAALGGLFLGLAESYVTYYPSSTYRDAIAFIVLILVLLFKPAGLLGTVTKEKV